MDDLIVFVIARLDEDEIRWPRLIAALRVIVGDMARTIGGEFIDEGERVIAAGVLRGLADIWSVHPDYRVEWKP